MTDPECGISDQSLTRPHSTCPDRVALAMSSQETDPISTLKWTSDGLIPAIVQDAENHEVLMMAWMDVEALRQTLATGQTHFYSRSRRAAWHKG